MLMAFLQRIVNGGGRIEREYGLGRGALDLLDRVAGARHAIEVKLRRDTETEGEALEQVARYLDHAGLDEGWLVIFDLRVDAAVGASGSRARPSSGRQADPRGRVLRGPWSSAAPWAAEALALPAGPGVGGRRAGRAPCDQWTRRLTTCE